MSNKLDHDVQRIDALLRQGVELQSEALQLLAKVVQTLSDDLTTGAPAPKARERHPNTGKPWTPQADEELTKLYESGNTVGDLSLYFQRTANGVRARLVKLGLLDPDTYKPRFAA